MPKVIKTSERIIIRVKGEDGAELFTATLSPLNSEHKSMIAACRTLKEGQSRTDGVNAVRLAVKYALKGVTGFENSDGTPYALEFDESKAALTDSCLDDFLNAERTGEIQIACSKLISGVFSELSEAPGVEVILPGKDDKKKLSD